MNYNTEAVVVRAIAYGETNVIVTLLTPNGVVAAMARGAKKPQSRLTAGVQLCVRGMYALYQNKGMGTMNQVEVLDARRTLREQWELAAYAAYFCELVRGLAEDRPNGSQAVYTEFNGALDRLSASAKAGDRPAVVARIWEAKVLRMLGASPKWTQCVRCRLPLEQGAWYSAAEGGCICQACRLADEVSGLHRAVVPLAAALPKVLEAFCTVPWHRLGQVRLSAKGQSTLNQVLRTQMSDYAGLSLKSRHVLDSLVADE